MDKDQTVNGQVVPGVKVIPLMEAEPLLFRGSRLQAWHLSVSLLAAVLQGETQGAKRSSDTGPRGPVVRGPLFGARGQESAQSAGARAGVTALAFGEACLCGPGEWN